MKRSLDMAPLEERFENDSTFQSLLVSQRELLSKLNYEKQLEQEQRKMNERASIAPSNLSIGFQSLRCDNVVFSKRFSIGVGNDSFILPDSSFDSDPYTPTSFYPIDGGKKRPKDGSNDDDANENKRRRTTLSFLDYLFDKNEESDKRRKKTEKTRVEYNDTDDEDYGVVIEDASDSDDNDDDDFDVPSRPRIDPTEAKDKMVSFEGAMGKSQDSQQAIHDWDRKMGLKRSHSKTMRLSSRSRKKLRTLMQKDIDHLKACLS